ncbi:MAG: hypothetical protein SPL29_06505, partial [Bacteroidales bacterium]|nr:hypothetical protein [Bacteroidales bacterium]
LPLLNHLIRFKGKFSHICLFLFPNSVKTVAYFCQIFYEYNTRFPRETKKGGVFYDQPEVLGQQKVL